MTLITHELLAQLAALKIPSRSRLAIHHRGGKSSTRKGSSLEFSDYREYLPGDDIRKIDWNAYARSERMFLKLFYEEESRPVYFVVDQSQSMNFGSPTKFDFALSLALCLCYVALRRYDQPDLLLMRDSNFRRITLRSQNQFFAMLRILEKEKPAGQNYLSRTLKTMARAGLPRGIYYILSDYCSEDGFEGMSVLSAAGNEIHCLQVLAQEELQPTVRGDLRLIDSENKETLDVSMNPSALKMYLSRLMRLQEDVRLTAHRALANYYPIPSTADLKDLLLKELRERNIVL